jgi:prepilin-type N-terminal cleavage/methylation domain-containing protein
MSQSGFSLMELLFVLAIIGIMLTATIMYFSSLSRNQAIASALQEVRAIMQAGAGYINTHGNYDGFNAEVVKKTNLIESKYNFTFTTTAGTTATTFLALPWTDEANGTAGVTIIAGEAYSEAKLLMPSQQYVLRFTSVPAWACSTLSEDMQLVATQLAYQCKSGSNDETEKLDFALPKLSD